MPDWIEEAKTHLREDQYPYLPAELPEKLDTKDRKVAYAASYAISWWLVAEEGVDPERAYHLLKSAINDARATRESPLSELDSRISTN